MKLVFCHGVFDLFHAGHLEHLRQARLMGDKLYVSVLADRFCYKRQPICNQEERLAIVQAIRYVDFAMLCNAEGPQRLLAKWKPEIYVRGTDYRDKTMPEDDVIEKYGITVRYTKSVPPTTTEIIMRVK